MKRIITETTYDDQGRIIKVTTTEEDHNDLTYAPYTFPYNPLQGPYPTPYTPSLNDFIYTTSASQASQSAVMGQAEGYFA